MKRLFEFLVTALAFALCIGIYVCAALVVYRMAQNCGGLLNLFVDIVTIPAY